VHVEDSASELVPRELLTYLAAKKPAMALLFVGRIMNLLWIAGLAILVIVEKIVPTGRLISRVSGALMTVAGAWLLVRAF
jgi:predicted metal-binding membrane protein